MFAFLLALVQLTSQPTARSNQPLSFTVEDARPVKEKKKNGLISSLIFDCDFGVYNISDAGVGDERAARDRVNGLKSALEQRFGERLNGHTVQVTHYRLLLNGAAAAKADSVTAAVGALAPMFASGQTAHAKCSRDKMTAGWFDASEITNSNSPIVVEFEGLFDGRAITARSVRSPNREFSLAGTGIARLHRADTDEFAAAYNATNENVAEAIAPMLR